MRKLIKAGRVLCGEGLTPVDNGWLLVEGGRIAGVFRDAPDLDAVQTIDFGDKVLMPGLIDTHLHLQFTPLADHESGREAFERDRRLGWAPLRATANARAALSAGVTTVRDCASDLSLLAVRDHFARTLSGPRIIAAGPPLTTTAGHCSWIGHVADNAEEIRIAVAKLAAAGVDLIKIMASGGNMTAGSNPLQPQYTLAEIQTTVVEAHRLGRTVLAHCLNTESIHRCVEAGVECIDHCTWQRPDGGIEYDDNVGRLLVASRAFVGATGSGILRVLLDQGEAGEEQLRRTLAGHRRLRELGAIVGVHSDAGVRFTHFERFDLSLKAIMIGMDLSATEILGMATHAASQILGLATEIGTIDTGKHADLLVLDGDPREAIDDVRNVHAVLRDGEIAVMQGRLAA
jgi:imidazolonepropionase-like amidohydrolase